MSAPRKIAALAAALALLTAIGCQNHGTGGPPPVATERYIFIHGHAGTFRVIVPVDKNIHADVATTSPRP